MGLPAVERLPGGARALLYAAPTQALGAMVPHRPRHGCDFHRRWSSRCLTSNVLAFTSLGRSTRHLSRGRATTSPLDEEAPGVGAGPLPVAAAVGGVPARGVPPLDATASAYVTSIDTFYVQY